MGPEYAPYICFVDSASTSVLYNNTRVHIFPCAAFTVVRALMFMYPFAVRALTQCAHPDSEGHKRTAIYYMYHFSYTRSMRVFWGFTQYILVVFTFEFWGLCTRRSFRARSPSCIGLFANFKFPLAIVIARDSQLFCLLHVSIFLLWSQNPFTFLSHYYCTCSFFFNILLDSNTMFPIWF